MIKFTLKCEQDHQFESWFQSANAFDKLKAAGMVTCAICGAGSVDKAIMAPRVQASRNDTAPPKGGPLSVPAHPAEQAIAALKKKVEDNSDYVGSNFAAEARDMHDGLTPERPIHGEAKLDDARKLIEDGIPVTPLPFAPGRKPN